MAVSTGDQFWSRSRRGQKTRYRSIGFVADGPSGVDGVAYGGGYAQEPGSVQADAQKENPEKRRMTGSLKQRAEGSWSIVLYLGKDPVTGKKRQKWHTFRGNKKAAQAELNRLVNELNTGMYIEPGKLTVKDYLEKWLTDYAKLRVGPKTYERYAAIVKHHLVPDLGALPLTKLTPLHVQGHYTRLLQSGRKDGREGGLSAQTVLHHHRVLSEALKQAVRWQLVPRNVC